MDFLSDSQLVKGFQTAIILFTIQNIEPSLSKSESLRRMARGAYRAVDRRPDPAAKFNLGVMLEQHGDFAGAEQAYRDADELGHAAAAVNLGVMLEDRGDREGAEAAYRRAQKRGEPNGAFNLGILLDERGDRSGAERAYRSADRRGHAGAACNLGVILAERRDLIGAEGAFRRAQERGDSDAAFNLEALLSSRELQDQVSSPPPSGSASIPASEVTHRATRHHSELDEALAPSSRATDHSAQPGIVSKAMRRHGQRSRASRTRRAALVLVPTAVALAGAFAFGSSLLNTSSPATPRATIANETKAPAASVNTVAQAPTAPPAAPAPRKPARKPVTRAHSAAKATSKHHTRSRSSGTVHHSAPRAARPAPTFVARRAGSSTSSAPRSYVVHSPAPSRPAPAISTPVSTPVPSHPAPAPSHPAPAPSHPAPSTGTSGGGSSHPSPTRGSGVVSGGTAGGSATHGGTGTAAGGG